jgi:3-oxoadipate enol-lactonase
MTLAWRADGPPDGSPLVLLNSIGTTTEMWTPCVAPLAERFRVIRIDTRGHGASEPSPPGAPCTIDDLGRDVLDVLDDLGLGAAHLAGVSLGAMTAMWLAIHHPQRVVRVGAVCTAAHLPNGPSYLDRAAAVRSGGMAAIADVPGRVWITAGLARRDPAVLSALQDMLAVVDPESYAQCCEALATLDLRPYLPRIAAPLLVLAGADDPATPPELGAAIAAGAPGAHFEVLADAAHLAPVEQPARVAHLLLEHFAEDAPKGGSP